jgi:hypothetical protein
MCTCLHVKDPLFFSDFKDTSTFLRYFEKNTRIEGFVKFPPMRAELFHAERRRTEKGRTNRKTDRERQTWQGLIVDFRNFSKAPKIILRRLVFLCYYNVNKSWRGLFKFDLPSTEVLTHYELGHVPQIRPTKGVQSFFPPDFSLSTQLLFMRASGCAYVQRVSFSHHCQPFYKGHKTRSNR